MKPSRGPKPNKETLAAFHRRGRKSSAESLERSRREAMREAPARPKVRTISPASPAQRKKVRDLPCVVTGETNETSTWPIDPAHLCPRAKGGCDSERCVIPLRRDLHDLFDQGKLDLLSYLLPAHDRRRWLAEVQHALDHFDGDMLSLLHRLTGKKPYRDARAA